jgi:hypothetical protein
MNGDTGTAEKKPVLTSLPNNTKPPLPPAPSLPSPTPDPRIANLTTFFQKYKCPQFNYNLISDYLYAADEHYSYVDYRLLPGISIQESSCGKHYPTATHNIWRWDSARTRFDSLQSGITFIADQLTNGRYYADKDLKQQLHAYNPNPQYAPKVLKLMGEIDSHP